MINNSLTKPYNQKLDNFLENEKVSKFLQKEREETKQTGIDRK